MAHLKFNVVWDHKFNVSRIVVVVLQQADQFNLILITKILAISLAELMSGLLILTGTVVMAKATTIQKCNVL